MMCEAMHAGCLHEPTELMYTEGGATQLMWALGAMLEVGAPRTQPGINPPNTLLACYDHTIQKGPALIRTRKSIWIGPHQYWGQR